MLLLLLLLLLLSMLQMLCDVQPSFVFTHSLKQGHKHTSTHHTPTHAPNPNQTLKPPCFFWCVQTLRQQTCVGALIARSTRAACAFA